MSTEQHKPTQEELEQRIRDLEKENAHYRNYPSAFLRNVSHELRTPMNSIIGFSGLLNDPGFTHEEKEEFISTIRKSSFSLLSMIEKLLDLAQIENGQLVYQESECNLATLLSELYAKLDKSRTKTSKQNVLLNTNGKLLSTENIILTDGIKLKNLLSNILDNAIKFTDSGQINFGYTTSNDKITFYVIDTGQGISQGKQSKIFDKFNQVSIATNQISNGIGMGLAISKGIAEFLGGKIWFESSEGNGTSFFFEMPMKKEKKRFQPELNIPKRSLYYSAS
ncbi:MAG: HAMP domain-containing sensor histidine kinase [Bacteroidota bacterium]|nr:HAMP domain-containing sensor histidine kinase [Bacteroidota bacterium]